MAVIGFSKEKCVSCGTLKKMMRFETLCEQVVCLHCNPIHPNNCSRCLEIIKNRNNSIRTNKLQGSNTLSHGQVF